MRMVDLIRKKRDGGILGTEEINFWIDGYVKGEIPDYQSSAMTMAICFQGMNDREMTDLTLAMAHSGACADLSAISGVKVDKHSTGGVGDKTSMVIGPIVAACGVKMAKMSGRGLGHTGGTLDKLEAVRGVTTELDMERFAHIVNEVGVAIAGQSNELAPADKKLYALRDVTATVESMPLIASSIMSKKLASGSDCILLDVKTGSGAFMKTREDSLLLAQKMVKIGALAGKRTAALITQMDTPLGNAVGNIMEVWEAMDTLRGEGPADFTYICKYLAAQLLLLAQAARDEAEAIRRVDAVLQNKSAYARFLSMLSAQGGDVEWLTACSKSEKCAYAYDVTAPVTGYVTRTDTEKIGLSACMLGAGRETKDASVDPYAGIMIFKKYGGAVKAGEKIATLYTNAATAQQPAAEMLLSAYAFGAAAPPPEPLICASVDPSGQIHVGTEIPK